MTYGEFQVIKEEMLQKRSAFLNAKRLYEEAVKMSKIGEQEWYLNKYNQLSSSPYSGGESFCVRIKIVPQKMFVWEQGNKRVEKTLHEYQLFIRKLKDNMKQKNREYSRSYETYIRAKSSFEQNYSKLILIRSKKIAIDDLKKKIEVLEKEISEIENS